MLWKNFLKGSLQQLKVIGKEKYLKELNSDVEKRCINIW